MNNQTYISELIEQYLEYKTGLGFELRSDSQKLRSFGNFVSKNNYKGYITKEIALSWISNGDVLEKTMGRRLETLRPFMKYAHSLDTRNEVFYSQIYSNVRQRPRPHIYSIEELLSLMKKCETIYSPDGLRTKSMQLVLGILWTTGMRPSEVASLTIDDFDQHQNTIMIRDTKLHKERIIPIHPTVAIQINRYIEFLKLKGVSPSDNEPLFYTTYKKQFTLVKIQYTFKLIRNEINLDDSDYKNARLYDMRHTFASRVVQEWLKNNEDINSKLYILSAYLGHEKPEDTYWYLSATNSLMNHVCDRYEAMIGELL